MRYAMFPQSNASHEALGTVRFDIAPYPVPEWTSRQAIPKSFVVPDACLRLALYAEQCGWKTDVRYARGRMPHAKTGRPLALKHSVSVRIGGHERTKRQAYAIYVKNVSDVVDASWTWDSVWVWGPDLAAYGKLGVTELKEWLAAGGQLSQNWFDAVTQRQAEQHESRKLAAKERAKHPKPRESGG